MHCLSRCVFQIICHANPELFFEPPICHANPELFFALLFSKYMVDTATILMQVQKCLISMNCN